MELQDDPAPGSEGLTYPTALEDGEAESAGPWVTEEPEPEPTPAEAPAERPAERPASARMLPARRVPSAPSRVSATAPPREAAAKKPPRTSSYTAPRLASSVSSPAFDRAADLPYPDLPDESADFNAVRWPVARPGSAPAQRSLSKSSVIRQGSSTPRRTKCDPVSLHARHQQQWSTNAFLANSPRRSVKVYSPAPVTQAASRRRPPPDYQIPTAKRRDALVMETRQRMRYGEKPAPRVESRSGLVCACPALGVPRELHRAGRLLALCRAGTQQVRASDGQAPRLAALAGPLRNGLAVMSPPAIATQGRALAHAPRNRPRHHHTSNRWASHAASSCGSLRRKSGSMIPGVLFCP